ncbi:hypothetical protein [Cryptosporangium phraense]|uniref:Uncharacterized protein n=1 Tax=Cryptosporangium phraense TaxID=2593070 RepID=A0A545AP97_9ACTN|nr:hypothetical protein [Cryptosporangium phraense]TQS42565.1 hypothetical protein FL583_23000 [Cryptosporangium phraense]
MGESAEALERRIDELRSEVRRAVVRGDRATARTLRADLRAAEAAWDDALEDLQDQTPDANMPIGAPAPGVGIDGKDDDGGAPPLLPLREQVHQALALLGAPAAPRLIVAVHEAFSGGEVPSARLTSLRRDEERSYRSAPHARPYYLCAALTHDLLAPSRGLLAISTWPMATRIIGPLSPRVDFLTAAIHLAEQLQRIPDPGPAATRLLWRFAANIPGAKQDPAAVARAAEAERQIHCDADGVHREDGAARARAQLDDVQQLFGSRLQTVRGRTGT